MRLVPKVIYPKYYKQYVYLCSDTQNEFVCLKPNPLKHLFITTNFTTTLLNCFVLEHSDFKTKQLRIVLVKLLVLN